MFERYLIDALTQHFGHLFELNAEQVRLSAWHGTVQLHHVSIKADALPSPAFTIRYGHVDRLELHIPWKFLRELFADAATTTTSKESPITNDSSTKTRCSLIVSGINVLVTPPDCHAAAASPSVPHVSDQDGRRDKERAVQALLDAQLLRQVTLSDPHQQQQQPQPKKNAWAMRVARLQYRLRQLLSEIQVVLRDVHVRYEDHGACVGMEWSQEASATMPSARPPPTAYRPSFAIGIVLEQFEMEAAAAVAASLSPMDATPQQRKHASARNLALYWDSGTGLLMQDDTSSFADNFAFLNQPIMLTTPSGGGGATTPMSLLRPVAERQRNVISRHHTYLLHLLSPTMDVGLAGQAAAHASDDAAAQTTLQMRLPPCRWTISRSVLEDVAYLRQSYSVWATRRAHEQDVALQTVVSMRPSQSVRTAPREWWTYAIRAVVAVHEQDLGRRRRGWTGLLQALRARRLYLRIYAAFLASNDEAARMECHQSLLELENDLQLREVAAFRLMAAEQSLADSGLGENATPSLRDDKEAVYPSADVLSLQHRIDMLEEAREALARVASNVETELGTMQADEEDDDQNRPRALLHVTLTCTKFSLQVNDRLPSTSGQRTRPSAVARMSFAFLHEQTTFSDRSWLVTTRVGSFMIKDLTVLGRQRSQPLFPYLIGPKYDLHLREASGDGDHTFALDESTFDQTIFVSVSRKWNDPSSLAGYVSSVTVRVLPVELAYATVPFEALSRIFSIKDPKISDDFRRLGERLSIWKQRQQERFLAALSHQRKTILIDVDIGAPIMLIPEQDTADSPLLVVDFGQMLLLNDDSVRVNDAGSDHWMLNMNNLQIVCTRTADYRSNNGKAALAVIEPFSLVFRAITRVNVTDEDISSVKTSIRGNLPRLAFNFTSSAMRLLRRLDRQWAERRRELGHMTPHSYDSAGPSRSSPAKYTISSFTFCLESPQLIFHVSNDVDPIEGKSDLLLITVRSLRGSTLIAQRSEGDAIMELSGTIGSVSCVDMYQSGGDDFAQLMASSESCESTVPGICASITYSSRGDNGNAAYTTVDLDEFTVQWNPETIAAFHYALRIPQMPEEGTRPLRNGHAAYVADNDVFFDAVEDDFYDADSVGSDSSRLISEICSSRRSSMSAAEQDEAIHGSPAIFRASLPTALSQSTSWGSQWRTFLGSPPPLSPKKRPTNSAVIFLIKASKVTVNFNKDARHRCLFVAEMRTLSVQRERLAFGGSKTTLLLRHVRLLDPDSGPTKTLYKDIFSPKDMLLAEDNAAEMIITSNPRERTYGPVYDSYLDESRAVLIDTSRNIAAGCDYFVEMTLSSIRIVYLQQLWSEVADYFFEAIIGYKIWGNERPAPLRPSDIDLSAFAPENVSFTRLSFSMLNPSVIIPVTYHSTNYVCITASSTCVYNKYTRDIPRGFDGARFTSNDLPIQWFNNCTVDFDQVRLCTDEHDLSSSENHTRTKIAVQWPVGPTASLNVPKWKVRTAIDNLHLSLSTRDYSTFHSVVSCNFGEETRNVDEWLGLKSLTAESLEAYLATVFVNFGYDDKAVAPTTFDARIDVERAYLAFCEPHCVTRADCEGLQWRYNRLDDRVSIQCTESFVYLSSRLGPHFSNLISAEKKATLRYSSTSRPEGKMIKQLVVKDAVALVAPDAWQAFSAFFSHIPSPTFRNPDDVIQVGDKWYSLGGSDCFSPQQVERDRSWLPKAHDSFVKSKDNDFHILCTEFRLVLENSRAIYRVGAAELSCGFESIMLQSNRKQGISGRTSKLDRMYFTLSQGDQVGVDDNSLLVHPFSWSCKATEHEPRDGSNSFDSYEINADHIRADLQYSNVVLLLQVVESLNVDFGGRAASKDTGVQKEQRSSPDKPTRNGLKLSGGVQKVALVFVDDSGRHFVGFQNLMSVKIASMHFSLSREGTTPGLYGPPQGESLSLTLSVSKIEAEDCLQPSDSAIRKLFVFAASSRGSESGVATISGANPSSEAPKAIMLRLQYRASLDVSFEFGRASMQFNPPCVLALKRYSGGIWGHFPTASPESTRKRSSWKDNVTATFQIDYAIVTLNTDDDVQSIAHFEMNNVAASFEMAKIGKSALLSVRSFALIDRAVDVSSFNQHMLSGFEVGVSSSFRLRFREFYRRAETSEFDDFPRWILSRVDEQNSLDCFLDIQMGALEATFVAARWLEVLNYFLYCLHRKGVAASPLAIRRTQTIRTTSKFFYYGIEVVDVLCKLPQHKSEPDAIVCHATARFTSWIDPEQAARNFNLDLPRASVRRNIERAQPILDDIVIHGDASLSAESLDAELSISEIRIHLSYSDFCLVSEIYGDNLSEVAEYRLVKTADRTALFQAHTNEERINQSEQSNIMGTSLSGEGGIAMSFRTALESIRIVLGRDDENASLPLSEYEFLQLDAGIVQLTVESSAGNGSRVGLSLQKLLVVDCGGIGRRIRQGLPAVPSAFAVLVDGCHASSDVEKGALLVVSYDSPAIDGTPRLSVVLNHLCMTALQDPIGELVAFLSKSWDRPRLRQSSVPCPQEKCGATGGESSLRDGIHIRVVLHYPRFMMIVDEFDAHSQALVVRGLAILNGLLSSRGRIREFHGDFQHISTHMIPDTLACTTRTSTGAVSQLPHDAVPLLLPLTIGLEYRETAEAIGNRKRSLAITMDPLSIMASLEDVLMLLIIRQKWSKSTRSLGQLSNFYDVVFETEVLGLGLKKEGPHIVVDASSCGKVNVGDELCFINDVPLSSRLEPSLSNVVGQLIREPRPLKLTFRAVTTDFASQTDTPRSANHSMNAWDAQSFHLSIVRATITLMMDADIPLFRSQFWSLSVEGEIVSNEVQRDRLGVKFTSAIDYFNLRVWVWEPCVERSFLAVTIGRDKRKDSPTELTVECSDRSSSPLLINATDSAILAVAKFQKWVSATELSLASVNSDDVTEKNSGTNRNGVDAANAALRFAERQKSGNGKPYVFKNETGLSLAFVVQQIDVNETSCRGSGDILTLGEYRGLQGYRHNDIFEVSPNQHVRFRVDSQKSSRLKAEAQDRFPRLTVALQAVGSVVPEPLTDLQIVRPGEELVLLRTEQELTSTVAKSITLSWEVCQSDEATSVIIGSTCRVESFLEMPVEIAVIWQGKADSKVHSLGIATAGKDVHVPVWLFFKEFFELLVRPRGDYDFASIFVFEESMRYSEEDISPTMYIECRGQEGSRNTWLAAQIERRKHFTVISIDCCLTIRNLLPLAIAWELATVSSPSSSPTLDSSVLRETTLKSGGAAEIFGTVAQSIKLRVYVGAWSDWLALTFAATPEDSATRLLSIAGPFDVPINIGVRVARKAIGLQVTLFAELWILNSTSLPVSFGASRDQIFSAQDHENVHGPPQDFSHAEAALKEFSSLFENGDEATKIRRIRSDLGKEDSDIVNLPVQNGSSVTEECFEYIEVEQSAVKRRWWSQEATQHGSKNLVDIVENGDDWRWKDTSWHIDSTGTQPDGWESSFSAAYFDGSRGFSGNHRYRRRRWFRTRITDPGQVNGFHHRFNYSIVGSQNEKPRRVKSGMSFAMRVAGGAWGTSGRVPALGKVHGVIRCPAARWPLVKDTDRYIYEVCYSIAPLEAEWGDFSRLLVVSSRFLLRNESDSWAFEVKQAGTPDSSAIVLHSRNTKPFHWADGGLPELMCVRPHIRSHRGNPYRWSGGFDPLTISVVPLRIRLNKGESYAQVDRVVSIVAESDIRPRTGGTGINVSFQVDDGSLFRISNLSLFHVWLSQDGVLADPTLLQSNELNGDHLKPGSSLPIALDVPYRQGKYSHRKAASVAELLRMRLALAPFPSRAGIETTKVVSLTEVGATVRLNPSKLLILEQGTRESLEHVRVLGVVINDGPTRVLMLSMMERPDALFSLKFRENVSFHGFVENSADCYGFENDIVVASKKALDMRKLIDHFPTENEVILQSTSARSGSWDEKNNDIPEVIPNESIVTVRLSFSGLVFSFVDASPSEIAVMTLKNINALASWTSSRTSDAAVYVTISDLQIDNMIPNAPYPIAVSPDNEREQADSHAFEGQEGAPPLIVVGLSFAPKHESGIVCLKSVTVAPRNLAVRVDLGFLVRLQKYALDIQEHFSMEQDDDRAFPDLEKIVHGIQAATASASNGQKFFFGGLTILPCNIKLSVAPARALTAGQAATEGEEASAIHQAVRKGDVRLDGGTALLGVKIGSRNATPIAVVRGVFKSIVVDGLLRLDGASLVFSGVSLRYHTSTLTQLNTHLGAHYLNSLRQNLPAVLGSLSAFGNPLGLVRGLGDGVSDFVLEPVKGFQKSVQQMDATHLVDGVARGTISLARHTVGGFANSAAALAETFSKNMTVLTLDRRYAQKRDRGENLRTQDDINVALGLGSGVQKLGQGFIEGVTGVVRAPMRGAEKRGFEGFAKGVGKGLLGLLVKPIIGISDGFTDVMIGVKGTVDGVAGGEHLSQIRPRRAIYGRERTIRPYNLADAAASALLHRTRLSGEYYLSHVDMGDRVALLSVRRLLILGSHGEELFLLKFKHIESVEVRKMDKRNGTEAWSVVIVLNTPRRNGSEVEVIACKEEEHAELLCAEIERGMRAVANDIG